jgi:glycosyltransferase involved in cell wall biosynthesis
MVIAIDASRSVATIQKTGVEKVSDELLSELKTQLAKLNNIEVVFYTPQEIDWLPEENQKILHWPFKFLWTQIRLAFELIFHPPEYMFFPVHAMPMALIFVGICRNRACPVPILKSRFSGGTGQCPVPTKFYRIIHDIAFKKQPRLYSLKQKLILNLDLWLARKLCLKIFVPTEAVRQDLLKYTKINSAKIVVVPWGYHAKTQNPISKTQKKKQILYIGRVEEKKNISNLIKAFELFKKEHPDYKLILAGKVDPVFQNHNSLFIIHNSIELLGYVSEEKKHELLRESSALVLVSKEEGFGFPILEAFDFGLPVVASDIPVLREVGGEACLYVNPDSPESIVQSFEKIITDENLSQELIAAGRERLAQFSWPKTAGRILGEILGE